MSGSYPIYPTTSGVRIVDMPDLGSITEDSSVVGEHIGSGRFSAPSLRRYIQPFNVKNYGAKGDGVTDDTYAIQAAINAAVAAGGVVLIPHGNYIVSGAGLLIDESGTPGQAFSDNTRISMRGEGPGNTRITYTGSGKCLSYLGSSVSAGVDAFISLADFALFSANARPSGSCGLSVTMAAYFEIRDLVISAFETGIAFMDALSFLVERVSVFSCKFGITGGMASMSSPNAVTLTACTLSFNTFFAMRLDQCDALTMVGGSVEANGSAALAGDGYGVNMTNPGSYGAAGATFTGVHFEGQQNVADILVQGATDVNRIVTINAIGCAFGRNSGTVLTTNCIAAVSNGGPVKLNVIGCGFRGFNDYVASAARPYISVSGTKFGLTELGNVYGSAVEAPTTAAMIGLAGSVVSPKSNATAWANFSWNGSAIAISDGLNIGSITRSSVGVYVVNFAVAMGNTAYIAVAGCISAALCWADTVTAGHVTVHYTNPAGTPIDPANTYVVVYGGAPF